jgi:hypothetical protein
MYDAAMIKRSLPALAGVGTVAHVLANACSRSAGQRSHLHMGQTALLDHLDDLGVERSPHRKFDAVGALEAENLGELTSTASTTFTTIDAGRIPHSELGRAGTQRRHHAG